ncbi:MAG: glycerol-3-phosphate dehydrogenase/oxidase [Chloroflexi bacterium]|nr:glycerol-3-phosphate dehydrogenase/oxidase [Chloroflexota bacterium]
MDRKAIIDSLIKNPKIDALIVGAGINGAGVFRDLALNGINVLIIDRGDFCSGTSSTSSHMAHGGIRYLENGEFRLVKEAVSERNRMILNAPHLVQPLPTVIPIFKVWSGLLNAPLKFINLLDRPSERGAIVIKLGLIFYDSFTRKQKTVPRHQFFDKKAALARFPFLNDQIKYSALYYDGQLLSPERMTVEIILDGEKEGPHAKALNYAVFKKMSEGKVEIRDEETGKTLEILPKIIINAAGPWVDDVNLKAGFSDKFIGGTKGSHLVIKNDQLRKAVGNCEFFFENKDGRIVLLLPFYDKVIIGTSDLFVDDPDSARCTEEEVDYFINLVNRVFPTISIQKEQIVFRFSGVRPLEYVKAKTTGQITRDHSIKEKIVSEIPILSLVGGKWTSFRAFAEQVTDKVLHILAKQRVKSTENLSIGGGKDYPVEKAKREEIIEKMVNDFNLPKTYCNELFVRYGTGAVMVASIILQKKGQFLKSITNWNKEELIFIINSEKVVHLEDIFLRRSTIAWLGNLDHKVIDEFADIICEAKDWTPEKREKEIDRTKEILFNFHGIKIE